MIFISLKQLKLKSIIDKFILNNITQTDIDFSKDLNCLSNFDLAFDNLY